MLGRLCQCLQKRNLFDEKSAFLAASSLSAEAAAA
jgi:hypothetical protein